MGKLKEYLMIYIQLIFNRQSELVPIINPDFDFESMGIGGLHAEFKTIFRRALISRVFPPEVVYQLGKISVISNKNKSIF